MKKIALILIALFTTNVIIAQNWNPSHPAWTDSFSANGFCWCNSTNFDHNLDSKSLRINGTNYNIVDVCDELEKHPSYRSFQNGDAPYNDIQCGNGPANDAADETGCPGRTDLGPGGCDQIGPTFDMDWLESRSRFGGGTTITPTTTPTSTNGNVVHMRKRNASGFAIDGDHGADNGQNLYLWGQNSNNQNQQWIEIDRGNGYYSYQKIGTNHCIDGNHGGQNGQNVYLWQCATNNQNQHWQKVSVGSGAFKLIKRNASGFALDGGSGGANGQNVRMYNQSSSSQNLHWIITPTGASAKSINEVALSGTDISVYPNPVEFFITATVNTDISVDNIRYRISDINGKSIKEINSSEYIQTIDMRDLSSGVYLLEINTGANKIIKKILKK